MKILLFLDIDGVLHADHEQQLARLSVFEDYLLQLPEVRVVISSTWREDYTLAELRDLFCVACRHQIIDVTPILSIGYDQGGRQREIEQFLQHPAWRGSVWLALDDWRSFFDPDCPQLLWIDPSTGFQPEHGEILKQWYTNTLQIAHTASSSTDDTQSLD